jgi:peptidase E
MLQQLDENNREIEQQRSEIRRLRQQVQMLVQGGGDTSVLLQTSMVLSASFLYRLCVV